MRRAKTETILAHEVAMVHGENSLIDSIDFLAHKVIRRSCQRDALLLGGYPGSYSNNLMEALCRRAPGSRALSYLGSDGIAHEGPNIFTWAGKKNGADDAVPHHRGNTSWRDKDTLMTLDAEFMKRVVAQLRELRYLLIPIHSVTDVLTSMVSFRRGLRGRPDSAERITILFLCDAQEAAIAEITESLVAFFG